MPVVAPTVPPVEPTPAAFESFVDNEPPHVPPPSNDRRKQYAGGAIALACAAFIAWALFGTKSGHQAEPARPSQVAANPPAAAIKNEKRDDETASTAGTTAESAASASAVAATVASTPAPAVAIALAPVLPSPSTASSGVGKKPDMTVSSTNSRQVEPAMRAPLETRAIRETVRATHSSTRRRTCPRASGASCIGMSTIIAGTGTGLSRFIAVQRAVVSSLRRIGGIWCTRNPAQVLRATLRRAFPRCTACWPTPPSSTTTAACARLPVAIRPAGFLWRGFKLQRGSQSAQADRRSVALLEVGNGPFHAATRAHTHRASRFLLHSESNRSMKSYSTRLFASIVVLITFAALGSSPASAYQPVAALLSAPANGNSSSSQGNADTRGNLQDGTDLSSSGDAPGTVTELKQMVKSGQLTELRVTYNGPYARLCSSIRRKWCTTSRCSRTKTSGA